LSPPACHTADFRAFSFRRSAPFAKASQIGRGEYVVALDVLFEVSRQSCCAQARAILYSDAILQEERHVSHNNGLHRSCAFHNNFEPKRAGVL
jgi:hypothetical protein